MKDLYERRILEDDSLHILVDLTVYGELQTSVSSTLSETTTVEDSADLKSSFNFNSLLEDFQLSDIRILC